MLHHFLDHRFGKLEKQEARIKEDIKKFKRTASKEEKFLAKIFKILMKVETNRVVIYQ
mgnify:CR=1 FL=1